MYRLVGQISNAPGSAAIFASPKSHACFPPPGLSPNLTHQELSHSLQLPEHTQFGQSAVEAVEAQVGGVSPEVAEAEVL